MYIATTNILYTLIPFLDYNPPPPKMVLPTLLRARSFQPHVPFVVSLV